MFIRCLVLVIQAMLSLRLDGVVIISIKMQNHCAISSFVKSLHNLKY